MGKSKTGGTRSYLRGRVGSDVYSIGRDGKGKKQQVVRSLAESVANPQTISQMRGRMIMSTLMQTVAVLKPIIDHSFDNVTGRQPNISEFISRNYALIKADVLAHPSTGNQFGLNNYGEKGAKQGRYIISDGSANVPAALSITPAEGKLSITLVADNITVGGLKDVLNLGSEEYFTLVGLTAAGEANYVRYRINQALSNDVAITADNVASVFAVEGNANAAIALASNVITITLAAVSNCCAVIVTKKNASGFIHSKAILGEGDSFLYPANIALATYPVGSDMYLNGGDIFGLSENVSGSGSGGGSTPVSNPKLTISTTGTGSASVTAGGAAYTSGNEVAAGTQMGISITPASGQVPTAQLNGSNLSLTANNGVYTAQFNMPSSDSTLAINTGSTGGDDEGFDPGD